MKVLLTVLILLCALSVKSQTATLSVGRMEINWISVSIDNDSTTKKTPITVIDGKNPCRVADGKIWDIRPQIEYYKTHMEIYGDFYKKSDNTYIKTDELPPIEYKVKRSINDTNWESIDVISKLSWIRVSGWVSRIETIDSNKVIFIDCWDVIKQRKVPSYCLYQHPKSSQFKMGDIIDCIVYYTTTNSSKTTTKNEVEYENVQYGSVDTFSETWMLKIVKTNTQININIDTNNINVTNFIVVINKPTFTIVLGEYTWLEAYTDSKNKGGKLATFETKEKLYDCINQCNRQGVFTLQHCWVSLVKTHRGWVWMFDNKYIPLDYNNWHRLARAIQRVPGDVNPAGTVGIMWEDNTFNDYLPTYKRGYILEK